jgi:protein-disulfide isomerase
MKKQFYFGLFLPFLVGALTACAPSAQQMSDLLEKHPEILTNAIEKNPDKFMVAVQKAAQAAQGKMQQAEQEEEKKRIDDEFKNPLKPVIDESRGFLGEKSAPITIVEYTDFQCPYCGRGYKTLEEVRKMYGDKVRVIVKNLPLPMHPLAIPAAKRFEAIRLKSPEKAYAFYHEVFPNQQSLNEKGEKYLDSVVTKVGANLAQVKKDMDSDAVKAKIDADTAEADKFDIKGTPGFVINGVSIRGAYPADTFKTIIDRELGGGAEPSKDSKKE